MSKYKSQIRKLIMQELSAMVGEEKLLSKSDLPQDQQYRFDHPQLSLYKEPLDDYPHDHSVSVVSCYECGGEVFEGSCLECGSMSEDDQEMLSEGCGCGGSSNEIDSFAGSARGVTTTLSFPGQEFDFLGSSNFDDDGQLDDDDYHGNNYMAKPSLYKVAKYSKKLLNMIPDGYELDDWQRTKIAQIADDISEVYHSLDYDFNNDDEF